MTSPEHWTDRVKAWVAVASFALTVIATAIGGTVWLASELSGVRAEIAALRYDVAQGSASIDDHRALERIVRDHEIRLLRLESDRDR